jgi:4-coumarate--CoA ligase
MVGSTSRHTANVSETATEPLITGLTSVLHLSMYAGLCVIVMRRFELQKFCSYVQKYRVTFANIVPPVVLLLAKHPIVEKYDLSSLKMLMCGSAPLTKEFAETAHKRIKVPIKQGYGLTETSPTTHLQPWDRWSLWGSVGLLLPNQVTMCVDTEGQEVLKGQSGELWIKGPNIFMGYFGNPMATRRAFSADGFFKTGDMGFEDHNGNFYITGRIEDQIDVGDAQIAPAELEGLLLSHPKVNDVAVLGIRDVDRLSQKPRAYILPMQGVSCTKTTGEEICSWLSERLPPHKRLTGGIRWVNSIPKSNSGKILRRVLTEQIERYEKKVKA